MAQVGEDGEHTCYVDALGAGWHGEAAHPLEALVRPAARLRSLVEKRLDHVGSQVGAS